MNPARAPIAIVLWLGLAGHASAGMTVVTLTDIARARIDALSFFLFLYLVIAWLVKLVWNQLSETFATLSRLNYKQALGVVFVTGLMFYVVLTMISGARELLTPGAWEKQGTGYRLREGTPTDLTKEHRHNLLQKLRSELWEYARTHQGDIPISPLAGDMDVTHWTFEGGGLYCLVPGVRPGGGREILVYEPSTAGSRRFVLLADGTIEDRSESQLKDQLEDRLGK